MTQYVIKTGCTEKSKHYLSDSMWGAYYYTETATIFNSLKDVNKAIAWGKKNIAKNIENLKKDIEMYKKDVAKGDISINKVMLYKSRQSLKEWKSMNLKMIKL